MLWGGWLLVTGLAFSFGRGIIHPYYTVALAPAIGAVVGIGGLAAWARRQDFVGRTVLAARGGSDGRLGLGPDAAQPDLDAGAARRRPGRRAWRPPLGLLAVGSSGGLGERWSGRRWSPASAGPAAYTLDTVATPHSGAIPSAGPAVTTVAFVRAVRAGRRPGGDRASGGVPVRGRGTAAATGATGPPAPGAGRGTGGIRSRADHGRERRATAGGPGAGAGPPAPEAGRVAWGCSTPAIRVRPWSAISRTAPRLPLGARHRRRQRGGRLSAVNGRRRDGHRWLQWDRPGAHPGRVREAGRRRRHPLLHRWWRRMSGGGPVVPVRQPARVQRRPAQITTWVEAHFASTTVGGRDRLQPGRRSDLSITR